jgi:polyadenylate-binding protein 2
MRDVFLEIFYIERRHSYVGQVEYTASPGELQAHFAPCGVVERVTVVCDPITGHSKGYDTFI